MTRFSLINFLTFVLLAFLAQPTWERESEEKEVLIVPEGTNNEMISALKDSLKLKTAVTFQQYQGDAQTVHLFGQHYTWNGLTALSGSVIDWIPEEIPNQLTFIQWDDLLHMGENQTVKGRISGGGPFTIQLIEQSEILEEDSFSDGVKDFQLTFRSKILGRNTLSLKVNGILVGEVRFFVIPDSPVQYSLVFGFPNPEGRFLSEYLVKRGDEARISSQISRGLKVDVGNEIDNNKPKVWIIDPSQLDRQDLLEEVKEDNAACFWIGLVGTNNMIMAKCFRLSRIQYGFVIHHYWIKMLNGRDRLYLIGNCRLIQP